MSSDLIVPSKLDTSILFVPESIQYSFRVTQSNDKPVGVPEKQCVYYVILTYKNCINLKEILLKNIVILPIIL